MDKKLTLKRLIIYIAFAFVLTWVIYYIGYHLICGYTDMYENPMPTIIGFLTMLSPAAANFITRAITHEGMKNSMLKFNIKGNIKYYIMAFAVIIVSGVVSGICCALIFEHKIKLQASIWEIILYTLWFTAAAVSAIIMYFGEEFGWRGYMFPKLKELMGTTKALIVSGIIWGLWHTPMLIDGHNFGKDTPLYPFSNIILMCVFCFFMGTFLTYLTERTNSIYPAAIAHALTNNVASILEGFMISGKTAENLSHMQIMLMLYIPISVVGIVVFIVLIKVKKNTLPTVESGSDC
jgi:membrane protease YdiL (CAAX protease family)